MLAERDLLLLTGIFQADAIKSSLAPLEGVEIIQADETQISLSVSDASHRLPSIFAAIHSCGEVRGTTLKQPSLESLFIKLTGKELRE
jgi:ABC-2 type transport system ATP-binding protein